MGEREEETFSETVEGSAGDDGSSHRGHRCERGTDVDDVSVENVELWGYYVEALVV